MNNCFLKKNGRIYIIAGKLKGRKISFNNNQRLRPTTSRIRETLFEWLSKYIKNSRCLDCFAGSGALGLEAISRNAGFLTLLEIEKKTIFKLKKNIKELNISNLELIHTNTLHWLRKTGKPYDIIFIDPPYYQELIKKTVFLLENKKWIKKDSLIYIEKEKQQVLKMPKNWILYKKKVTSQIEYSLYIFDT
ncbi:16S rRNA (guanine(966)-N(2))-methyltransferase RsmD [Buchnera aphidicola]|uniref:Ribosomal RNA small subunit methyltransferase D n=1 Tax=Buchnera aphidicola str. USDA (Myzus persicae) TaxID=1009856 RepID=W0P0P0_BUCMP|nr:16S rRNA (guanine(966)-N(2))-methyltransferase RsmD [Buchnera aphidicola]AHG60336.1 Yhhf [Buchnera aphidicola str. USDA (Myzus persicae)]AHG60914.1 Yhhf [Buchnera aphidicola str. W106 (Myzus persicae)]AHG61486.1 Yhhf [Buchnera aphidicola str. G002 (Myzus persicae)]AHG62059.1 Yhhf [Buchnera aphidicola str. F009 (Myzus persicae)]WAI02977.1 MAG: 16S rRNA (guanine(966)-N(2))-methyltransferase RsmD [Buchnera aphidicola (Myzus persicae)]